MTSKPVSHRIRKVVVFGKINQVGIRRLEAHGGFDVVETADQPIDRLDVASDADAVIVKMTHIDEPLIARASNLAIVCRHGLGFDTVDVAALTRRGIPLAVTKDVVSGAVAEHTLALMLAVTKQICTYDAAVRQGQFAIRDSFAAVELRGRVLLLIGYGRIGRKVAGLAQAFGVNVIVYDPFLRSETVMDTNVSRVYSLQEGLAVADIVSIHAPKPHNGQYLLDAKALAVVKAGAIVINVARGGMVDEAALLKAIKAGRVAGAGLDVYEREPPPGDDPLMQNSRVVLTPHSAGYSKESSELLSMSCAENVIDAFEGRLDPALVVNSDCLSDKAWAAKSC